MHVVTFLHTLMCPEILNMKIKFVMYLSKRSVTSCEYLIISFSVMPFFFRALDVSTFSNKSFMKLFISLYCSLPLPSVSYILNTCGVFISRTVTGIPQLFVRLLPKIFLIKSYYQKIFGSTRDYHIKIGSINIKLIFFWSVELKADFYFFTSVQRGPVEEAPKSI